MSSTLIEFLHGSPFFVVPQQEPGPPLGLTSISQTRNGFQGSMVVIEVVVKGRKCFGLWWCWAITAAFPRQLYMPSPWAPYLHGCVAGMEHFLETVGTSKNAFTRSMRRIQPISGLHEGISFQTTAAISCTFDYPSPGPYIGKQIGYCGRQRSRQMLR